MINIGLCILLAIGMQEEMTIITANYFDAEEYLIGPGDEIWVSLPGGIPFSGQNEPISVGLFPIAPDGSLNIPTISRIDTDGMSFKILHETVAALFSSRYRGMEISMGLSRSASFQIPITGQIARPGIVTVNGLSRLSEALSVAGGITSTAASSSVVVVSISGDSTIFNLNDFTMNGNMTSNPLMQRNSRIHVPAASATIAVEGAISNTAARLETGLLLTNRVLLEYIPGENAKDAVIRAGGVSREIDINSCYVQRMDSDSVSLRIPFSVHGTAASVLLQPGDRVVMPALAGFINVNGQVTVAGPVPYSPGMTVNYYIGMAGGFTELARQSGLSALLSDGSKIDADLIDIVSPGATILVPRIPVKFWEEYLVILTGVATVVIAYQSIFD